MSFGTGTYLVDDRPATQLVSPYLYMNEKRQLPTDNIDVLVSPYNYLLQ